MFNVFSINGIQQVRQTIQRFMLIMVLLLVSSGLFAQGKLTQSAEFVPNRVIVKFKSGGLAGETAQFKSDLKAELRASVAKRLDLIDAEVWDISGNAVQDAVAQWKNDPRIEYIEPDYIVHALVMPNDPSYAQLWGMTKIQADLAWDTHTGTDVIIGVIDTGVDYNHPDLAANMWVNTAEQNGTAGVDDDNNGYVDDIYGYDFRNNHGNPYDTDSHGTHVAGTIAAVGNNGVGVVGVNWSARIMALKFLDPYGSTADAIEAVQYAIMMGAQLTNNSWGGGGYSQALYDAIAAAEAANQLFVAAAGNDYSNNDVYPHYPSNYNLDNVISVAATDINDLKAGFSNYGATSVDLGAPGVSIYSTIPGNSYGFKSGTSMASPHVAGVAALIWSLRPELWTEDVKAIIMNSADPIAALSGITVTGARLDAYDAITLAQSWTPLVPPAVSVSPTSFSYTEDPDVITTDAFSISNASGSRKLFWDISASCTWLSVNKSSGKLSGGENEQITMTVNTTGLIAGNYQCTLSVNSNDPNNPTVQVIVDLTVNYLPPPAANVTPTSLTYSVNTGESSTDQLTIANDADAGHLNLHWSASIQGSVPGISINPSSGTAAPGANNTMQVSINTAGVSGGTYQGSIDITTNDPVNQLVSVPVELMVNVTAITGQKLYAFFGIPASIVRADLDGQNASQPFVGLGRPIDGAVDVVNRKLYYIDWSPGINIYRADLNGLNKELLYSFSGSYGAVVDIALDVPNNHMYFAQQVAGLTYRINRANLDGSNVVTLADIPSRGISGINIVPSQEKIYWAGNDADLSYTLTGIWRANLDLTGQEQLTTGAVTVSGLALDVSNNEMYWYEARDLGGYNYVRYIRKANMNGTNPTDLIAEEALDLAIDPVGGKIYWTVQQGSYPNLTYDTRRANLDGTNIQALNVYGQRLALDLSPANINDPPVAVCQDITVSAGANCQAEVTAAQVDNGSYDPDGDPIMLTLSPTGPYPLGDTDVTLTVSDGLETSTCSATITVVDDTPPVLTVISDPIELWPPNHKYETIDVAQFFVSASDHCDGDFTVDDVYIASVSSDEAEDAPGEEDGDTVDDIVISQDCKSVKLRRERQEYGNGRVYTLTLAVDDENGNTGTATCQVTVPDSLNGPGAVDDGATYTVNGVCGGVGALSEEGPEPLPLPENFALEQNYPNPFNPTTNIRFALPEAANVTLRVYNINGQLVRTLLSGTMDAGYHSVQWDSVNDNGIRVASGIYIYRMTAGGFVQIRKMILMK